MSKFFVKASSNPAGAARSISSYVPNANSSTSYAKKPDTTGATTTSGGAGDHLERSTNIPAEGGTTLHSHRQRHLPIQKQRELLPIYRYRDAILYLLEKYQTLVLIGGSLQSFHLLSSINSDRRNWLW